MRGSKNHICGAVVELVNNLNMLVYKNLRLPRLSEPCLLQYSPQDCEEAVHRAETDT